MATNNSSYDAAPSHVAWASQSNTYLVTWHEKDVTDDDDVWMQILGPDLSPVTPPSAIAAHSVSPKVTSDGIGFWVTYTNYDVSNHLASMYVTSDGTVTPIAIANSGGAPGQSEMLERGGQPVLVWTETGGSGPDLYFDPMCP